MSEPIVKHAYTERTQEEQRVLYLAFARLYTDASKPETFENAVACYKQLVDPNPTENAAKKTPYRYLKNRITQTEIARIKVEGRTIVESTVGMTHAQYIAECIQNSRLFAERGMIGDSTASAQMLKLAGTALGYLVVKTEDVTPKRGRELTPSEELLLLEEKLTRLKQLRAPAEQVQDADYEIVENDAVVQVPASQ